MHSFVIDADVLYTLIQYPAACHRELEQLFKPVASVGYLTSTIAALDGVVNTLLSRGEKQERIQNAMSSLVDTIADPTSAHPFELFTPLHSIPDYFELIHTHRNGLDPRMKNLTRSWQSWEFVAGAVAVSLQSAEKPVSFVTGRQGAWESLLPEFKKENFLLYNMT